MAVSKPYQGIFGPPTTPPFNPQGTGTMQQSQPSGLDRVLSILNSPLGAAGIQAAGAGLAAYGANKQNEANRQQNAQQFSADMAERQREFDSNQQQGAATAAAAASPLGADQMFAQRQALAKAILGSARNIKFTPGDPAVAAAMGTVSGGMQLPENGLDPAMLERLFGDQATLASIGAREKAVGQINPHATPTDLAPLFGAAGATTTADIGSANAAELQRQLDESAKQRAIIQRAIDEDIRGEKQGQQAQQEKHGNFFGGLLKTVGKGLSFVPGVGQIAAPILTGVGGLVNGDGFKHSLIEGGLSAIPGLGAAGVLGKTGGKIVKNPITSAILGGM